VKIPSSAQEQTKTKKKGGKEKETGKQMNVNRKHLAELWETTLQLGFEIPANQKEEGPPRNVFRELLERGISDIRFRRTCNLFATKLKQVELSDLNLQSVLAVDNSDQFLDQLKAFLSDEGLVSSF
jgi:hypothetical protein